MASTFWQPRPWKLRAAAIVAVVLLAGFGWFVIDLLGNVLNK